jgi:hypothetical protein
MHRCSHCTQETVAPIIVTAGPILGRSHGIEVSFCCWPCLAIWANKQAGGILMPDLDSDFFGSDGPMEKWG